MSTKYKEVIEGNRVTIPLAWRQDLGINVGDTVKMTKDDGKIIIEKVSA